jgi:hypothetical protein
MQKIKRCHAFTKKMPMRSCTCIQYRQKRNIVKHKVFALYEKVAPVPLGGSQLIQEWRGLP